MIFLTRLNKRIVAYRQPKSNIGVDLEAAEVGSLIQSDGLALAKTASEKRVGDFIVMILFFNFHSFL